MRGKIIHYNANDGRGLIAAGDRQWPFTIDQWRSDTAPAVNQVVDVVQSGDTLESLARVPDEVLLKEKASLLAGKLGSAGGAALQSIKDTSVAADGTPHARGWLQLLGKPLLIAHGLFALAALALPYLGISSPFGGGRSYTLAGLSQLSEQLGAAVGGAFWVWVGIASIALPLAWRSRWAWLALLLPLFATVKPVLDIAAAARQASRQMGDALGADMGSQIAQQIADMVQTGIGAFVCVLASLFIAALGIKRALLPPTH